MCGCVFVCACVCVCVCVCVCMCVCVCVSRAEEFGQNYIRSAATSVDKSENSPQFSYIILR